MENAARDEGIHLHTEAFYALNIGYFLVSSTLAVFFVFNPFLIDCGIDPAYSGVLIGTFNLSSIAFRITVAPRLTSKKIIFLCMGLSALLMSLSLLLYIPAHSLVSLFLLRALNGIAFAGLFSSVNALCPYFIPQAKSGTAFSIISVSTLLPYVLIPPLSGTLFTGTAQNAYMIASASLCGILFIPLLILLRAKKSHEANAGENRHISGTEIRQMLCYFPMSAALFSVLLFYAGYAAVFYFLDQFGRNHGMSNPGLFFSIAIGSSILIRFTGFKIFDKVCKFKLSACAFILLAPILILTDIVPPELLNILACFYGICWGIIIPMLFAIPYDLAEGKSKGLAVNFAAAMLDGGFLIGPLLGSLLLAGGSWLAFFTAFGILSFCGGLLLLFAAFVKARELREKTS